MDIVDLLKTISVRGMKLTIEYNWDYDCHIMTVGIDDIESKTLVRARDLIDYPDHQRYLTRDICQMVKRVTREKERRVSERADDSCYGSQIHVEQTLQ